MIDNGNNRQGMKVCMLIGWLPPHFSGAGRQALHLAPQLQAQGVQVWFLSSLTDPQSPREDVLEGFPVFRVPYTTGGKWQKFQGVVALCRLLMRRRHEFDLLHVHGPDYLTLAVAWFARTALRKPVLVKMTLVGYDNPQAVKTRKYGRIAWWLYQRVSAYVCISTAQYEDGRRHGIAAARLHLIANGVNTGRFQPAASRAERDQLLAQLGLAPGARYGVFIGSIEQRKGVDLLVEAAAQVCAVEPAARFLLIGPDGSRAGNSHVDRAFVSQIRARIQAAGLEDRILLLGERHNPEAYLRVATFFLFTSRAEGFGTVLAEAMATGLPCVALRIPGVTGDILDHDRTGIIIEREDPGEFSAAMVRLLAEPDRAARLGQAARTAVLERYDIAAVARRYVELYRSLLERPYR